MAAAKPAKPSKSARATATLAERRERQRMAALAQRYVDRHQPDHYRIAVVPDAVERRGDTWFVVAEPDRESAPTYDLINRITEASMEMEDAEKVDVFIVPVMPPDDD